MEQPELDLMHDYEDQVFEEKLDELMDRLDQIGQEAIMTEKEIVVTQEPQISLGQMMFSNPAAMVEQAKIVAKTLKDVITAQKLFVTIQSRKYVLVEGWTTLGAMLGITARTVSTTEIEPGIFEATVELVRASDGMIVGQGIAECGAADELDKNGNPTWANRARYAKKSMAITRATGKAFRLSYSWIIKLAGYEGTPAEEMPRK